MEEMLADLGLGQAWPGVTLAPDPWLPRGGEDEGWGWGRERGGCWLTFTRTFEDVNASPGPAGIDGVRVHRHGRLLLQVGWKSCRQMG